MTALPLKASLTVYDDQAMWLVVNDGTSLLQALALGATKLTADQRYELIERLQKQQAEAETRFR